MNSRGRRFRAAFVSVAALTAVCLFLHVVLVLAIPEPTGAQADLIEKLQWAWMSGAGGLGISSSKER